MVKPKFVHSIRKHGHTETIFDTEVINSSICSRRTVARVTEALIGVVENGTARNLKNPNFKIAGKTGTAQIAKGTKGYKSSLGTSHQASFVGFFPAEDPKFSCIVVVSSPSRSVYYGNVVAGPVFKEIADKVYATNPDWFPEVSRRPELIELPESKGGFKPMLKKVFSTLKIPVVDDVPDNVWVNTKRSDEAIELSRRSITQNLVPNVIGMSLQDAFFLLENAGLRVSTRGRGYVRNQSIPSGTRVSRGDKIYLEMSLN
jgi:cell division protein FtsI (penicillin-binding protein 3)